jgi:hypothetical protein
MELAAAKDAPSIFEAYKSFEESKARAIEEAERLKKQQEEEEERLRLEEEGRKVAGKYALEEAKISKKEKKGSKGKKGKVAELEEVKEA